ncbi:hypothetical protein [Pseudomonas sp. AM4(2022)]|uniref:hypothetical protein n=1 Tax=Pseudomonas sp. AM4(2022) TaxID=2983408 RepID=UPI002E8247BC|nr:hypothetical protein [Pseudomonas sp. AM4(2022)]
MAGRLTPRVVDFLDKAELTALLGEPLPADNEARAQTLREQLSGYVASRKDDNWPMPTTRLSRRSKATGW